jgi:antitoxin VapB
MPRPARRGVRQPNPLDQAEAKLTEQERRLETQLADVRQILGNIRSTRAASRTNGSGDPPPVIPGQYAGRRTVPALEASLGEHPQTDIAKLFPNGRSQAVRLPREFRFKGDRVRVRRVARGVLLEPIIQDTKEWFAKLAELNSEPFLPSRNQPPTPKREAFK